MIHVLIIEDEPAIARGLSLLITKNYPDFQISGICKNGRDGLQKILELKPELVFTDITMPVMNGLDMIEEVQRNHLHTRFVILTGYADFEYARKAIHLGVSDYLLKPIDLKTLDDILLSCLEQQKSETRLLQKEYLQCAVRSDKSVYENLALHIGVHEGEDHTGDAIGMVRVTPWEAIVVAADVAVKAAHGEVGFMDRFCGTLILTGGFTEVMTAVEEVVRFFHETLKFDVCKIHRS